MSALSCIIGVLFGDPSCAAPGGNIFIENVSPKAVMHAENVSTTPSKLAVHLLQALFTHEELSHGNCTKPMREDIVILDQKKIQAIRGKLMTGVSARTSRTVPDFLCTCLC